MGRSLVVAGALLAVTGAAVSGFAITSRPDGGVPEKAAALAAELLGEANLLRTIVLDRAGTLAASREVKMAVATDATTARDMLKRRELGFELQPTEVVELGAVSRGAPFAERSVFLRQPDSAAPPASDLLLGASASWLEDCDHQVPRSCDKVVYTTVYEMAPVRGDGDRVGYVLVSRQLDLKPAGLRLTANGNARCGERGEPPRGWVELVSSPASGIGCFIEMPPTGRWTASIWLGAGAVLAGLVLLVAGIARRSPRRDRNLVGRRSP